jgi:hypothetical protein
MDTGHKIMMDGWKYGREGGKNTCLLGSLVYQCDANRCFST